MQGVALLLYLYFNGLTSLFVVSGIFGLFQGGIVPMYAVICRELLPPREAGARIGLVVSATIFGMAFGGYFSGVIFDLHQLLPHGVPERRPVERVQFRHRRLAVLASPGGAAAAPHDRRPANSVGGRRSATRMACDITPGRLLRADVLSSWSAPPCCPLAPSRDASRRQATSAKGDS